MPDVRVARPLLEDTSMTDTNTLANAIEPMIDAKQAAAASTRWSHRGVRPVRFTPHARHGVRLRPPSMPSVSEGDFVERQRCVTPAAGRGEHYTRVKHRHREEVLSYISPAPSPAPIVRSAPRAMRLAAESCDLPRTDRERSGCEVDGAAGLVLEAHTDCVGRRHPGRYYDAL